MSTLTARTGNDALAYEHSENHLLEFFSKAGGLFVKKGTYYGNEATALELFKTAWRGGDEYKCMQLLFWLRDIRNSGAGNRSGSYQIWNWLANESPNWVKSNIKFIPELGRWDDLFALYNTPCEKNALKLWASAIKEGNGLAAKWADRQDAKLRKYMDLTPKTFRKLLVQITNVVETDMCNKNWAEIEFSKVPSVAIGRYNKAFYKHDKERYDAWRKSLVKIKPDGTVELTGKVNAGALFPHDLVRTVLADSSLNTKKLVEGQLLSMPDLMNKSGYRIMPIIDTSGSMSCIVSGSIRAIDVSIGMGLYCSDKLGKDNPFYRKVIPFATDARFISWEKELFGDAIHSVEDGYMGSTNIKSALYLLLNSAKMFNIPKNKMINCIMILSDMQFNQGISDNNTPVEECLNDWEKAGYDRPKVIYWNLAGYKNQPATKSQKDVALVSGFSPALLSSVLGGKDFSPMGVMNEAICKYKPVRPKS